MRRGLIVSICILLTISLCVFFTDKEVKAADGYVKQLYQCFTPNTISGVSFWQNVTANTTLENFQASQSDKIPSNVWSSGYSLSFGIRTPWSNEPTNNAWGSNCTYYFGNPNNYQTTPVNYYESDGVTAHTYNIKYPCAFINYYPSDVTIPSGYTTLTNSFSRNVVYPKPSFVNSRCGNVLAAVIVPQGQPFLLYTGSKNIDDENPMDVHTVYTDTTYAYYNSLGESGYTPFYFFSVNDTDSQTGWGNIDSGFCTHADVPVFCDLYEALNYSVTGTISDTSKVLYGLSSAVTPTPSPTPSASPTGSPSTITGNVTVDGGSVSIDGGTVNIGNFPTAEPTPTPIVPYYDGITTPTPRPPDAPDIELGKTGNAIVDNTIMPYLLPGDYIPGNYNFTPEIQDAIGDTLTSGGSMINSAYLDDIKNGMGTVFTRLPLAVADDYLNPSRKQTYDDVSFASFFTGTLKAFSPNDDVAGGFDWDGIPRIYIAVIISSILVVIVKKIIH